MNDHGIETLVSSLSESIDWPEPTTDLAGRIAVRIGAGAPKRRFTRGRRVAAVAVAAAVVALIVVMSPSARRAIADVLGEAGVRISVIVESEPIVGAGLELGEPVELDDVARHVDFPVRRPRGGDPGAPDSVYLDDVGQVTLVWTGAERLPAAGETGIGLLLSQRPAYGMHDFGEKGIGPDTSLRAVTVEGNPALWIEGAPHVFTVVDSDDRLVEESARLAANALLWESSGVNHRLETTGDLASALAIVDQLEELP